jgi:hypothetical protein
LNAAASTSTVRRECLMPNGILRPTLPRYTAVAAYLHERDGGLETAARLYVDAAEKAANLAEHATRRGRRPRLNSRR